MGSSREEVDVYSWGRGDLGQLGTSTGVSSSSGTPTLAAGLHDRGVVNMAGSLFHSVALTGE
jgi:alpha-tubulin suppressor-like RCC1 family protein